VTLPINIKRGWIQITISPEKRFDNPGNFQEMIDPDELLSCWRTLKHIVDGIVDEQINRSRSVIEQSAKTRTIVDLYNILHSNLKVDENILLKDVLKTGNFSEEEARSLIKKVKQEKIEGGMAWY